MKVLLLNTSERTGGAAVASNRLMRALQKQGIEVKMLVRDKQTNNESVISINSSVIKQKLNWIRFVWERFVIFICNCFSRKNLFQVSIANTGTDITKLSAFRNADIIHLHWINQGFLSLSDLKKIIDSGKPIVWTMHDLWSATSICHYPGECLKYQKHCQECPMLSHPVWDLSHQTFKQKEKLNWAKVHFVGCSRWITHLGMQSVLLQSAKFHSIPNALPASFSPTNKSIARQAFGLPANKFLILFGAAKISDQRKGADFFIKASRLLASFSDIEIILMGNNGDELSRLLPFKTHILGYLSNEEQIAKAYSCADAFVIPSLEDNLPNTIMEAMACGTPCVGFATGGIPEMIDHLQNGYVAEYKSAEDLANGIRWVLEHPDKESLSKACVEKVKRCYAEEIVAKQYIHLYEDIL